MRCRVLLNVNIIKPTLDSTTRKSRIESLCNTIAKANNIKGYQGCDYDTQANRISTYIDNKTA